MKRYIISSIGLFIGLSLIVGGLVANKVPVKKQIIEQAKEGEFVHVKFIEGKDTLAYDYLTVNEYDSIFNR